MSDPTREELLGLPPIENSCKNCGHRRFARCGKVNYTCDLEERYGGNCVTNEYDDHWNNVRTYRLWKQRGPWYYHVLDGIRSIFA